LLYHTDEWVRKIKNTSDIQKLLHYLLAIKGKGYFMEDGESGNSERKNSKLRSDRNQSTRFYFFAFLLFLGWEGPFGIYLGLRDGSIAFVIVGLFITVFLWGLFGIEELKKFLKDLRR
jgi:hypothetical protein